MSTPRQRLARQLRLLAGSHSTERDPDVQRVLMAIHDLARGLEAAPAADRASAVTEETPALLESGAGSVED